MYDSENGSWALLSREDFLTILSRFINENFVKEQKTLLEPK